METGRGEVEIDNLCVWSCGIRNPVLVRVGGRKHKGCCWTTLSSGRPPLGCRLSDVGNPARAAHGVSASV